MTVKISFSTPFAATSQINVLTHKYQRVYKFEYSFGEWQLISVAGVIKHCQKRILARAVISFGPPVCQNEVVAPLVSFRKHIHTLERGEYVLNACPALLGALIQKRVSINFPVAVALTPRGIENNARTAQPYYRAQQGNT